MTDNRFIARASGVLQIGTRDIPASLGRSGTITAADKREGDGASPIGVWRMKRVFYRPDRLDRPVTALPTVPLKQTDGWCDAADHPLYNRPVTLPFAASHEKLWREDHAYDVIVELAHNDAPVIAGLGSAIFFHLAHEDGRSTEGCVAIALTDMVDLLRQAPPGSALEIATS